MIESNVVVLNPAEATKYQVALQAMKMSLGLIGMTSRVFAFEKGMVKVRAMRFIIAELVMVEPEVAFDAHVYP